MGNAVSALKRELDEVQAVRGDALAVTPTSEDGRRARSRTPRGGVVSLSERAYREFVRLPFALAPPPLRR